MVFLHNSGLLFIINCSHLSTHSKIFILKTFSMQSIEKLQNNHYLLCSVRYFKVSKKCPRRSELLKIAEIKFQTKPSTCTHSSWLLCIQIYLWLIIIHLTVQARWVVTIIHTPAVSALPIWRQQQRRRPPSSQAR